MTQENQTGDLMLPEPSHKQKWQTTNGSKWISGVTNYYTADQMREYAKKAVAVELERCITELERNADKTLEDIINAIRARSSRAAGNRAYDRYEGNNT